MGQVVPFIARVRDSGDWTPGERARLEDLADQLGQSGLNVEVIFGATDEGDPWCVVTDADGDVLIHVARIGGVFVVHSAVDDAVHESGDLHAALRDRLAATEEAVAPKSAVILPFELRQAQTLLALVVAAAFFYETAGIGDEAQAAEPPHAPTAPDEPPPPVAAAADDGHSQDREAIARGAALQADDVPAPAAVIALTEAPEPGAAVATPEAAPALPPHLDPVAPQAARPSPPPVERAAQDAPPPVVIHGTDRDDLLVGTAANERILGGAGNDTLAGGGGHDTLDGGAGDDRIELDAGVVAIGGQGADTFVIRAHAPAHTGPAPAEGFFFGVILDYSAVAGDRIVNGQGVTVRVTPHPTDGSPTPGDHGVLPPTFLTGASLAGGQTVTRVDVDLNGDGVNDGFLLVGHRPPPTHADDDPPIGLTGQSFHADPLG